MIQIQQVVAARQEVFLPSKTDLHSDYTSVNDCLAVSMSTGPEFLFTATISTKISDEDIQTRDCLLTLRW